LGFRIADLFYLLIRHNLQIRNLQSDPDKDASFRLARRDEIFQDFKSEIRNPKSEISYDWI